MTESANEVTAADISAALDNSSDKTVTSEPPTGDNSNSGTSQEPENNTEISGNSQNQDENQNEAANKPNDTQNEKTIPKFDNLEAALKGYANLEKKFGEQSNEIGELRKQAELAKRLQNEQLEIAKSYGFESVDDFKNAQLQKEYDNRLTEFEADQYAQHLDKCEYPEEMQKLLLSYRKRPTKETLDLIEADFPIDVVKQVAASKAIAEGQLQVQQQEAKKEQLKGSAKAYLDENVAKYSKDFENDAFVALYGEAFKAYGCDLDTDKFVNLMRAYADSVVKQTNIKNGIDKENTSATDEIAGLVNRSNAPQSITNADIDKMSDKELAANIRKFI